MVGEKSRKQNRGSDQSITKQLCWFLLWSGGSPLPTRIRINTLTGLKFTNQTCI